ncbi:hypothetical protein [Companilactobacillus zhachilii]|uniref:hypothetical protein n=1 Tax=Companilactobacillus zhachilii TaxID=2304606 RepID=UPI004034B92B
MLLSIIVMVVFLLFDFNSDVSHAGGVKAQVNNVKDTVIQAPFIPSEDGVYESMVWSLSGFNVQPKSDYFVKSGNDIFIHTHSGRTVMNWGHHESVEYHWYESIDDQGWHEIKNDSEDLSINLDKNMPDHERLYQASVTYDSKYTYYSKIAHVHINHDDVKATELKIKAANKYLYSLGDIKAFARSTNVSATINPENSTSKVLWTLGKFAGKKTIPVYENNLAMINSKGLLTAKDNVQGIVKVTGYIINDDGTILSDSVDIEIGRAVEDKVGVLGKTQTFEFKADKLKLDSNSEIETKWLFKKGGVEKAIELPVDKNNPFFLTTKPLTVENNGDQYAFIMKKKNANGYIVVFQTRYATLKVNPPANRNVTMTTNIKNLNTNESAASVLNNITDGNELKFDFTVQNNGSVDIRNLQLITNFRSDAEITSIMVDDKEIDKSQFEKSKVGPNLLLAMYLGSMSAGSKQTVTVIVKETNLKPEETHVFSSELMGKYADTGEQFVNSDLPKLNLNYVSNRGQILSEVKAINFEPIFGDERNTFKNRTDDTNAPNFVVSIQDARSNKHQIKVSVKQLNKFTNENGDILDAHLAFFNPDPQMIPFGQEVVISQTKDGEELHSIQWDKGHGLKLHLGNSFAKPGKYQARLEWDFVDAV